MAFRLAERGGSNTPIVFQGDTRLRGLCLGGYPLGCVDGPRWPEVASPMIGCTPRMARGRCIDGWLTLLDGLGGARFL